MCKNNAFQNSSKLKFLSSPTIHIILRNNSHTTLLIYFIDTQVIICAALNCTFASDPVSSEHILQPLYVDLVLLPTKIKKIINFTDNTLQTCHHLLLKLNFTGTQPHSSTLFTTTFMHNSRAEWLQQRS